MYFSITYKEAYDPGLDVLMFQGDGVAMPLLCEQLHNLELAFIYLGRMRDSLLPAGI